MGLSAVIAICVISLLDYILGALAIAPVEGLVLPPNQHITYRTPEFTSEVAINLLGFRDREFAVSRTADFRIVVLGDSFTYGWGVTAQQAWPKILETNLRAGGSSVEIANLGRPGADPDGYAEVATRAIPVLRPDLGVVAIVQGDDLAQMSSYEGKECPQRRSLSLRSLLKRVFPNSVEFVRSNTRTHHSVTGAWQRDGGDSLQACRPDPGIADEAPTTRRRPTRTWGRLAFVGAS